MKYVLWVLFVLVVSIVVVCVWMFVGVIWIKGDYFVYLLQQVEVSIRLGLLLDVWNVSCDKCYVLVWGCVWDQIQLGDVFYFNFYLFDFDKGEIVVYVIVSSGFYEIEFSQDQILVCIDEWILCQVDGMEVDFLLVFYLEMCVLFVGKNSV